MSKKKGQQGKGATLRDKDSNANPATLAVLGPKNTYSDYAADKFLAMTGTEAESPRARGTAIKSETAPAGKICMTPARKQYFRTIAEIFSAVEKGICETGIVPLENIIYGSIRETYDLLVRSRVHITDKFALVIEHVLATLPGTKKSDIHIIASHQQALEQCRLYLTKHFPNAKKDYCESTISALEKMINNDDRGMAVIIPERASQGLPLKVIAKKPHGRANSTTFIAIKKGPCPKTLPKAPDSRVKKLETSIAFHFSKDSPGSLFTVFREFATQGINLSYIESRPSVEIPGNYVFYLNFESTGSPGQSHKVLTRIKPMLAGLKVLGVYPKR